MSVGAFAIAQDGISAQPLSRPPPAKPPANRLTIAIGDQQTRPEPR